MKKKLIFLTFILSLVVLLLPSCADEETRPEFPLSAIIHNSIDGKQAAFVALTHSAVSWEWDFGDGNTSTDKETVHVYKDGGYYDVV
ncbi:MAG: PKD domain-containing protein, partial [Mariniphaga sp.]|nr:PKD domain-containing protein [Mariniphaga sp.]